MHQPVYRDLMTGTCSLPWVRLHATKDYLDMLTRLEPYPNLHQTFNLVPSLLDQLEAYGPPTNATDRFLELSEKPAAELTEADQRTVLEQLFMANTERMIRPHPRYYDLLAKRGYPEDEAEWVQAARRFRAQEYLDLQVWFNLAWIDPWLRQHDEALAALEAKGAHFSEADKRLVLERHRQFVQQIVPAYRAAQQRGQVELTCSPYYHPIMPLLCDLRAATRALPDLELPDATFRHPEDARWHLQQALASHETRFGRRSQGLWPSEGSVSEALVGLAIAEGIRWIATDEEILWRTLGRSRTPELLYRPHRLQRSSGELAILFRDRELSDLVGFVYSQWRAELAVQDFLGRLGRLHEQAQQAHQPWLVNVILDGENAWEHYPNDGHAFLSALYEALARDARFRVVTVSEFLDAAPLDSHDSLPELFAGSWIDANFATWIGHHEKNTAWVYLARAREDLERAGQGSAAAAQAWRSFYAAEGSDWMWWFGDTHSSAHDAEFDRLFRLHLGNAYRQLDRPVPEWLQHPVTLPVPPAVACPTATIRPTIDGLDSSYYEWLYAGALDLRKSYAAIHRGAQRLLKLYYGFDEAHWYLRLDVDREALHRLSEWRLQLHLPDQQARLEVARSSTGHWAAALHHGASVQPLVCAYQRILEVAIPRRAIPVGASQRLELSIALYGERDTEPLERYPLHGAFRLMVPTEELDAAAWSV